MKKILFILLALLLFSACKKETKIERNLWTKGGKWDIVKYEKIVTSSKPSNNKNEVTDNYGIFQFKKNGSGWIISSAEYDAYIENFNYTITENELSISYFESEGTETYDLDWKKNAFTITIEGTSTDTVYSPNPDGDSLTITTHRLYRYTCEKE
jgi:hypothetical protein